MLKSDADPVLRLRTSTITPFRNHSVALIGLLLSVRARSEGELRGRCLLFEPSTDHFSHKTVILADTYTANTPELIGMKNGCGTEVIATKVH